MILPDVNVLIYAFRTDSEDHEQYKQWLESVINGPTAYGIAPQVLASVVRISTHPPNPSPVPALEQMYSASVERC